MYKNILVPLDGSELAEGVLSHVATVAKGCAEPMVTLMRVVEPIEIPYGDMLTPSSIDQFDQLVNNEKITAEKYLNKLAKNLTMSGIKTTTKVIKGKAADTIIDYASDKNIDLIIFSTHGRSGLSRWFWGSVADRVLRHVCVPVLMVRAPGCGLNYKP
jgi:nucleotide-binding universal stress UspA family protein